MTFILSFFSFHFRPLCREFLVLIIPIIVSIMIIMVASIITLVFFSKSVVGRRKYAPFQIVMTIGLFMVMISQLSLCFFFPPPTILPLFYVVGFQLFCVPSSIIAWRVICLHSRTPEFPITWVKMTTSTGEKSWHVQFFKISSPFSVRERKHTWMALRLVCWMCPLLLMVLLLFPVGNGRFFELLGPIFLWLFCGIYFVLACWLMAIRSRITLKDLDSTKSIVAVSTILLLYQIADGALWILTFLEYCVIYLKICMTITCVYLMWLVTTGWTVTRIYQTLLIQWWDRRSTKLKNHDDNDDEETGNRMQTLYGHDYLSFNDGQSHTSDDEGQS
jgi:hypothetical protein